MSNEEFGGGKCAAYQTVELGKSTDFTRHKAVPRMRFRTHGDQQTYSHKKSKICRMLR